MKTINHRETKIWCSFNKKGKIVGIWWKDCVTKHNQWRKSCRNLGAVSFDYYFAYGRIK